MTSNIPSADAFKAPNIVRSGPGRDGFSRRSSLSSWD